MHKYGINMLYVLKGELNAFTRNTFFEHLVREDKCVVFSALLLLARIYILHLVPTILLVVCFNWPGMGEGC
jgi:hypothetical protein